ncbi:MAG: ABC transporter ATP-binding protein [Thermoprotei archaeon]|nr:MAG: ABC transporter ATP-binding protein [Thermoprotei archaeon]
MGDVIIDVQHITMVLGSREILRDVSISVERARVVALLGPNGAGKTTLLRTILGLVKPVKGTIAVNGRDVYSYSRRELSKIIAYVPQEHSVVFPYKVIEVVVMGRAPYRNMFSVPDTRDFEKGWEVLKELKLEHLAHRLFTQLSGGEKRLVLIARALTQEPRVLLLDEPTSGLDIANKVRVLNLLKKLARSGKAVVFTTHDPNEALAVADKVVVLNRGRVVFADEPVRLSEEILEKTYGVPMIRVFVKGFTIVVAPSYADLQK